MESQIKGMPRDTKLETTLEFCSDIGTSSNILNEKKVQKLVKGRARESFASIKRKKNLVIFNNV